MTYPPPAPLSPIARRILIRYIAEAAVYGPQFWDYAELRQRTGHIRRGLAVYRALAELSDWCRSQNLPDISAMMISVEKRARGMNMPARGEVRRLGGPRAVHRAQEAAVSFDWAGYLA